MSKDIRLFWFMVLSLFVSSFSILLSFWGDYNGTVFNVIMAYAVGVLFWAGLFAGYFLLWIISKRRKNYNTRKNIESKRKKPGIICFFSNKVSFYVDVLLVLLILFMIIMFIFVYNDVLAVVTVAIFLFMLHMHSILNGVNFTYIYFLMNKESRK